MSFHFRLYTDVHVGTGLADGLSSFVADRGFKSPLLLIDEGFRGSDRGQRMEHEISKAFGPLCSVVATKGTSEPTYDDVRELAATTRPLAFDVVVAAGGGSCLDLAKTMAALQTNPGDPLLYRGFDALTVPAIPSILIPTTAGTGSEVTINASFVDTESGRKMGINGRYMHGTYAILDGALVVSCPFRASLSAGADALVHAVESFSCNQANPLTRALAEKAFDLLFHSFPALRRSPDDADSRTAMLMGAYLAGASLFNSGSGVASAISYPFSCYYPHVPHGIGGGMFLTGVIRHNIEAGYRGYSPLAHLVSPDSSPADPTGANSVFLDGMERLFSQVGMMEDLSSFGIGSDRYEHIVEIMQTQQPAFDQNPVPFTVDGDFPTFIRRYLK